MSPPVYTAITLPATICGQYGKYCSDDVFCFNIYRDTDWYQFVLAQQSKVGHSRIGQSWGGSPGRRQP